MLSTENPPSDPPCIPSCEISPLIKSGTSDETQRASDKVPLQEVDLLKSGLDYDNNPLPKFSIRDYVFSTRSKDINTNWPFSQKNLKLCLKHGVKDLLPPFQPLESVRNRSVQRCTAETNLIEKENIGNADGEPSMPSDGLNHVVSASCDQNLALECVNTGSSGSEGERDNQLAVIDSVPADRTPCEVLETDSTREAGSAAKVETNQPLVKKCRLIVKVGSGADPCSNEDTSTTGNCVAFSETMASKVCPVCKTFSSSSNTTLNAHIDQCLSLESNMKWTPNSRVIKHRIKPRKTRLMVDIYATAPHCTLEELDRRNGTNWAANTSFPTQETLDCAEEERQIDSPVHLKEKGDEGAVYIDANGTKVRILSKFNDALSPIPKKEVDLGPRKIFKGGKGSKLLSNYKKKHQAQKHQKRLKLAFQSMQFCSSKPRRNIEVCEDGERSCALVENCRKVGSPAQPFKAQEQIKTNDSGTMMKWACSKRTGLLKRRNHGKGLQDLGCNFRQELPAESDRSSLGDTYMERTRVQTIPDLYESPLSSPESRKRMRNSSFKTPFSECNEDPHVTKKVGFTSLEPQISGSERFLEPPEGNVKQLRIESTSGDGSCKDFTKNERYVPPRRKGPSRARDFASIRECTLSANQSSVPKSKYKVNKKFSSHKKSGMRCMEELDKEVMAFPSKVVEKHDSKEKRVSLSRNSVSKLRKKRGAFGISRNEESVCMRPASECHGHEVGNNLDSPARVGRDFAPAFDDTVIGPSLGVDLGGNAMSLSRSLAPEFHKLGSPSNTLAGSLQSTHPILGDEQQMFCVDEVGNNMLAQTTGVGEGMDPKDGQGNYFTEVDPIPIPGPPGSFLPSPRDMGSEDLQGSSSITTSRVQSSEDHHDLVDRDSSDSPISATSTICNSMMARSDSKSSEKMSVVPQLNRDEIRLGFSVAGCDAAAENAAPVLQAATVQSERVDRDELRVNMIVPERGPTSFRNDQPCCCSRREGMSQGVSLNYQESPLLRRRTVGSVPVPATGKQPSCDPNRRPNGSNLMPEVIPRDNFAVTKSAVGSVPLKVSADSALNSPIYVDCDSASPSASNSVLRLMGKNLMVVNKEENVSQQFKPAQSISPNDHPNPPFQTLSGVSPGIVKHEDFPSFYRMVHQHPNLGFGNYATSKTPQASPHASSSMFFSTNTGGGLTKSLEPYDYKFRYHLPNDQFRSRNRNVDSHTNPMKEIIVIDDTPVREADSASDKAAYSEGTRENQVSSAGISIAMASNYNSRHANPFHSYQPQGYSANSGPQSHMVQSASFQMPPPNSNLRSPLYYSPSFS